uniref:Ig-like domain-containing protein n=1 Tax=Amphilophus citrinellus TaxID=61819 RepID=A0A3Q0S7G3_AMPCI
FSLILPATHIFLIGPVCIAQKANVLPKVTGYLGKDVTLSCKLIQGSTPTSVTQVQWAFQQREGTETKDTIIVFHHKFGMNISDSPLKERVNLDEYSLIIKNVEMRDKGSYTCSISTFPSGTFEGTTKLDVQGKNVKCFYIPSC